MALYAIAARLGHDRSIRLLARLPLVERADLQRADRWFCRHGKASIFFGRLQQYSRYLNYAVWAVLAGLVVWLIVRRVRRRRADVRSA